MHWIYSTQQCPPRPSKREEKAPQGNHFHICFVLGRFSWVKHVKLHLKESLLNTPFYPYSIKNLQLQNWKWDLLGHLARLSEVCHRFWSNLSPTPLPLSLTKYLLLAIFHGALLTAQVMQWISSGFHLLGKIKVQTDGAPPNSQNDPKKPRNLRDSEWPNLKEWW